MMSTFNEASVERVKTDKGGGVFFFFEAAPDRLLIDKKPARNSAELFFGGSSLHTMARHPNNDEMNAAKGNPSKRRRPSKLPVDLPSSPPGVTDVPTFVTNHSASACDKWQELAPALRRYNLFTEFDRDALGRYCCHMADWVVATKKIRLQGVTQKVKTVSGDEMIRLNPAIKVRELAERHIEEAVKHFGLAPDVRYGMLRDMNALNVPLGGLFDHSASPPPPPPQGNVVSLVGLNGRRR